MVIRSAPVFSPFRPPRARTLIEPPPPGYDPSKASFKELGIALSVAAPPVAGLVLGGYAGMATGVGPALAGAVALGAALGAGGFLGGLYADILNGISGRETNLHKWGLGLGIAGGAALGGVLGYSVANPWVAGAMAVTGAVGGTYWAMFANGR